MFNLTVFFHLISNPPRANVDGQTDNGSKKRRRFLWGHAKGNSPRLSINSKTFSRVGEYNRTVTDMLTVYERGRLQRLTAYKASQSQRSEKGLPQKEKRILNGDCSTDLCVSAVFMLAKRCEYRARGLVVYHLQPRKLNGYSDFWLNGAYFYYLQSRIREVSGMVGTFFFRSRFMSFPNGCWLNGVCFDYLHSRIIKINGMEKRLICL